MKKMTIERQFFTWKDWDELGTLTLCFYNCVFTKDVGTYKKGQKVPRINMDYETSTMDIFNGAEDTEPSASYRLILSIEE